MSCTGLRTRHGMTMRYPLWLATGSHLCGKSNPTQFGIFNRDDSLFPQLSHEDR